MKIIVTGSLGHISKPLTEDLVQKGHSVTVISSQPDRQPAIEALGATAAIGSVTDLAFLEKTFAGADAVYTMIPPPNYFDPNLDLMGSYQTIANSYVGAIRQSGVKRVVHLSSIGAHLSSGSGLILCHHAVEGILDELDGVGLTFMRPSGFYYNLFGYINLIKTQGFIAANYGADDQDVWVSPLDIAAAVAEEIVMPLDGRKISYVASDELTGTETARILGEAIGKPDLQWKIVPAGQVRSRLEAIGMAPQRITGLIEMNESIHTGALLEDYFRHRPAVLGRVKMSDFARDFAAVYHQK